MALIKCPECGKEISDKTLSCPNCGSPINEQKPVVVRKDYKSKAKTYMITGIIIFLISGVINIAATGFIVGLKAQYVMGNGGAYPIYNFLLNAITWVGLIILAIGVIYWMINKINK